MQIPLIRLNLVKDLQSQKMKIHLFGASGAGCTTQGKDLAEILNIPFFDTDDYFWAPSSIPFTKRRSPAARNELLKAALEPYDSWIVSGSLVSWGPEWKSAFDLAVFLYVPHDIRMERLRARELARYGDIFEKDVQRKRMHEEFMEWASSYDTGNVRRSLAIHTAWMNTLSCPVLTIKGDMSVAVRREIMMERIREILSQAD
ncbi:Adenylate kinase [Chitinophaga costaii]|uniref:Adenylate kinase n=2 Tax=Chitinophaga costaii TaxID=1335309 RepID=A0A1C4EMS0_9BACT|nr:Adenylate kinase [Chitinophaga costaii]